MDHFEVKINKIGISIIDHIFNNGLHRELLFICYEKISLLYKNEGNTIEIKAKITDWQVKTSNLILIERLTIKFRAQISLSCLQLSQKRSRAEVSLISSLNSWKMKSKKRWWRKKTMLWNISLSSMRSFQDQPKML